MAHPVWLGRNEVLRSRLHRPALPAGGTRPDGGAGHAHRPRHRLPRRAARGDPVAVRGRGALRRGHAADREGANRSGSWRNGRRRCRRSA
ncbi:MAG: hypothetical protein MZV64_42215 [Ignavibacteriales bacterium]|nr:hypothetical protein [Ignavibacteriales bacterium]